MDKNIEVCFEVFRSGQMQPKGGPISVKVTNRIAGTFSKCLERILSKDIAISYSRQVDNLVYLKASIPLEGVNKVRQIYSSLQKALPFGYGARAYIRG